MQENKMGNTQFTDFFTVEHESEDRVKMVLAQVYDALREKGYNPANQIVGYIMSGDPTYITSHNGARSLIMKIERDELVEEMFNEYIKANGWE
ncbi:MAG: IreB family regulatory phosphoprotein [Lachnospiraceae bacterium]|nr:IreB family regulatory phosphoprotein [Lachnospiraceae bacterium]